MSYHVLDDPHFLEREYFDKSALKWNLSFAGCGFLGMYHVGVCHCIKEFAPYLYENQFISGASAGAIAATCLLCNVDITSFVHYLMEVINKAKALSLGPFDPRFHITEYLSDGLNRMLPRDAHVICSGRLHISLTSHMTSKNVVVSNYSKREDLIRAILCSAYIPVFSGFIPLTYNGEWMVDGGITNNILELNDHTITVSPFYGAADICPREERGYDQLFLAGTSYLLTYTNLMRLLNMVWPRSPDRLLKLAQQGYDDTLKFLAPRGLIRCKRHRHRVIAPPSTTRALECDDCRRLIRLALSSNLPADIRQKILAHAAETTDDETRGRRWWDRVVRCCTVTSPSSIGRWRETMNLLAWENVSGSQWKQVAARMETYLQQLYQTACTTLAQFVVLLTNIDFELTQYLLANIASSLPVSTLPSFRAVSPDFTGEISESSSSTESRIQGDTPGTHHARDEGESLKSNQSDEENSQNQEQLVLCDSGDDCPISDQSEYDYVSLQSFIEQQLNESVIGGLTIDSKES